MRGFNLWMVFILVICILAFAVSCAEDDDDSSLASSDADDDDAPFGDDDAGDDSRPGDNDFTGDDTGDEGEPQPDDYLADWPQVAVEERDYDEEISAGAMRQKAEEYDLWHETYHQPYHGGTVGAVFTDDSRTEVSRYFDWNDSCEWTGLYLGSQAMRYHVTGDPQARANVVRVANYLSGNLHVTGIPAFIARYWAEQDSLIYAGDDWCDSPEGARCHRIEEGPFAGNWWWGETSRDMYGGWFFGMALAYDLVDDEDMREMIRADVLHVLTVLKEQNWKILNEIGEPTDSAPNVMPPFRFSWLTIGYHITGDPVIEAELRIWLKDTNRKVLRLSSISFMNRYTQYFGSCLAHEYWYNLLRLGRAYFSPDDVDFLFELFETQTHTYTRLSHNPFFNGVYMGQGDYRPEDAEDPYQAQLVQDLTEFRSAPNDRYHLDARDPSTYELDPMSVFLHDLMEQYPDLQEIMGNVRYQAEEAFPVGQQCTTDFLFQRNPFRIEECGSDDPRVVNPGVDYLIPYWMASYHGFVCKDF